MYQLTAKTGGSKGAAWVVSERPLIIGRDITCDITISDPIVSRHHCQVIRSGETVTVTDLGSSNSTFVNAQPVKEQQLKVGDEVAIGNAVFILTVVKTPSTGDGHTGDSPAATHSLRIGEPTFVDEDDEGLFAQGKPRTAEDLAMLFHVARALSQAATMAGVITTLLQRLEELFDPEAYWIALSHGQEEPLEVYPPEESATITANAALHDIVRRAIQGPKGILYPERWSHEGQMGVRTTLVAPIALARESIGAVILQVDTPKRIYDEADLELLLAVANTSAPYLSAVERLEQLEIENERLVAGTPNAGPIIGETPAIGRVRSLARNCARSDLNVIILGETGTGKELVARMIHDLSGRKEKPLVIVNCAAIPDDLFESEVFGHERGAFTGAHASKVGLFEESDGGTLFLDEVGDTSLHNQARLLRAIETGTFRRVGGTADIQVHVRVVSATNKDLVEAVSAGSFRRDLYHRLNAFEIHIPPLRDRRKDIPLLAGHFLAMAQQRLLSADETAKRVEGFKPNALEALQERPWPGNVRELCNVVERALVVARHGQIRRSDLVPGGPEAGPETRFPTMSEMECQHITEAVQRCSGNITAAAELLKIGRSTLYRKVTEYGIPT